MLENTVLEILEQWGGAHAEFVAEVPAQLVVGPQRLRLITGLVVRGDEDRPQRLSHRVLETQAGQIADDGHVVGVETIVEVAFRQAESQLAEAPLFVFDSRHVKTVDQWWTPPQTQKRGDLGISAEGLPDQVDVGRDLRPVAVTGRDDHMRHVEFSPETGDVEPKRAETRIRRSPTPGPIEELIRVDHAARLERQQSQQRRADRRTTPGGGRRIGPPTRPCGAAHPPETLRC